MATPINKILTNQQQVFSPEELANVSASLSAILGQGGGGGGGEPCASAWLPSVDENGNLSWTLSMSTTTPDTANIMGPQGPNGQDGAKGKDGTSIILQSVTDVAGGKQVTLAWGETPSTSSFVIPSGTPGTPGVNGVSPTVTITDAPTTEHPQGGKTVTITDADHPAGQSFDIWNGIDGQGATVNLVEGDGIQITHEAGTTNYTIGVSADYALKSELPDVTDMATKTWVSGQGYLTAVPDTYATKEYANNASANALSQAQSWVETEGYLKAIPAEYATKTYANEASAYALSQAKTYADSTSAKALSQAKSWTNQQNFATSAGLDDNKQYAMTKTGWTDFEVPSTSGYLPLSGGTVSGQLEISATSGNFDSQFLKLVREGVAGHGRVGLGQNGALALKADDANQHTTQVNINPNAANDQLVQVQHGGTTAYLIPAQIHQGSYTPSENDGILHIIVEN